MPGIYRGSTQIKKIYRGSTEFKKIYRGSTLLFSASGAANLYCVKRDNPEELFILNIPNPGASTLVGALASAVNTITGMTSHNGELLGVSGSSGGRLFWLIDPVTPGNSSLLGSLPSGAASMQALASHGGVLYGVRPTARELWELNRDSLNLSARLGFLPGNLDSVGGMASHDGKLLAGQRGSTTIDEELWEIDLASLNSSHLLGLIPDPANGYQTIEALASHNGILYAEMRQVIQGSSSQHLLQIDTGALSDSEDLGELGPDFFSSGYAMASHAP